MCKAQPVPRMDGEAGAGKLQDQAAGNAVNIQHCRPRSTRSCEAAPWDKSAANVADGSAKDTLQKAQPGPTGSKPPGMTGPLQNSLGCSTELWWWGCLCRDNPELLPGRGSPQLSHTKVPQSLGHFWGPVQSAGKKAAVCLGLASFSQMSGGKEQQSWPAGERVHLQPTTRPATSLSHQAGRRGCPQAPGAAQRASGVALARAGDA